MAKKHGPPLGKSKKKTCKDIKSNNYRSSCASGYLGPKYNAHHVVPCVALKLSLIAYLEGKPLEYKRALAFFTNWDVNAGTNLLGLPVAESYQIVFKSMKKRSINVGRPAWIKPTITWAHPTTPKYPIHIPATTWKHDVYNTQVQTDLDDVWADLKVKHKNHDPIDAPDLGGAIQDISDTYRGKLEGKTGQTIEDWENQNYAQFYMV